MKSLEDNKLLVIASSENMMAQALFSIVNIPTQRAHSHFGSQSVVEHVPHSRTLISRQRRARPGVSQHPWYVRYLKYMCMLYYINIYARANTSIHMLVVLPPCKTGAESNAWDDTVQYRVGCRRRLNPCFSIE